MMKVMTRAVWTTAITMIIAGSASAADLKAPVYKAPPQVPFYDWTGFYIGVNAGIGVGRNPSTLDIPTITSANRFALSPLGAIGGVQAGFNKQFGNWVFGLETDIQASGQNDGQTCLNVCTQSIPQFARIEQSLDWFGTVRGRIGYATGPTLAYYTGGFAYGGVKTSISETLGPGTGAFSFRDTMTGWTMGSGVETAIGGNWTGKIEYLYLDLGSDSIAYTVSVPHTASTDIRNHIFRAGLNYRIGGTPAAAYPTANWTGFYIGGNAGGGLGRNESATTLLIPIDTMTIAPRGFIGGAQIGYNWQASNIVFGVEADFQGSTMRDDNTCVFQCFTGPPNSFMRPDQKMPWFGTLRGRIGYAAGPALFYFTGGLAYARIETDLAQLVGPLPGVTGAFSFSDTKTGWVIGGGIEQPFDLFGLLPGNNWTMKTEYLYTDYGSITSSYTFGGAPQTFTSDVTTHIFRTGINYHFSAEPVMAKY